MPIKHQRGSIAAAGKKATSSSNKSISQRTVTVITDRKTDGTVPISAMTKNLDSKLSESHTNVESEVTDKTQTGQVPQNISSL